MDYQDGKALLISNKVIDYRPFGRGTDVWENSGLRSWLNKTFLETAFTEEEQAVIVTTTVDNSEQQNNPKNEESGSADT